MSRISDYFLSEGINQLGISHEVIDGKLTIKIRQNKFNINENESYFKIGDDLFWIKEKKELNNKTVYTVSHIVQHESKNTSQIRYQMYFLVLPTQNQ